jgi:hypothetical protein
MLISHAVSMANGFKKWSLTHSKATNDDYELGGTATPVALTPPIVDDVNASILATGTRTA